MNNGWVKLHRKIEESQAFQDANLLKVWVWCLVRANHSGKWVPITTGRGVSQVRVEAGQFIFGRKTAAKALKMKPSSVQYRMGTLRKAGNLVMQPGTHYTLVTLCQWDTYQHQDGDNGQASGQPTDNQLTTNGQPSVTNKNDKNGKKVKKTAALPPIPLLLDTEGFRETWEAWKAHRGEIRKKLTPTSVDRQFKRLESWGVQRAIAAIEHTIMKGWEGIREPDTPEGGNGEAHVARPGIPREPD